MHRTLRRTTRSFVRSLKFNLEATYCSHATCYIIVFDANNKLTDTRNKASRDDNALALEPSKFVNSVATGNPKKLTPLQGFSSGNTPPLTSVDGVPISHATSIPVCPCSRACPCLVLFYYYYYYYVDQFFLLDSPQAKCIPCRRS